MGNLLATLALVVLLVVLLITASAVLLVVVRLTDHGGRPCPFHLPDQSNSSGRELSRSAAKRPSEHSDR